MERATNAILDLFKRMPDVGPDPGRQAFLFV